MESSPKETTINISILYMWGPRDPLWCFRLAASVGTYKFHYFYPLLRWMLNDICSNLCSEDNGPVTSQLMAPTDFMLVVYHTKFT